MPQEKHFIYFYYNQAGELLYIGKAVDVGARWNGHNEPWKKEVCKIGVITCPDRAAMDVLENYFIAKMPTKYNKAGLHSGYTSFEIPNLPLPTVYTVAEFKAKYIRKESKSRKSYPPMEERIQAERIEIIDVGPQVDVMQYLDKDLDRVCFRYKNMYLFSEYSHIPTYGYRKKSEVELHHRTNEALLGIKKYHEIPNKKVALKRRKYSKIPSLEIVFTTDEEGASAAYHMFREFEHLYDFYEVKPYRPNHDVIHCLYCFCYNSFGSFTRKELQDGIEITMSQSQLPELEQMPHSFDGESFIYDFEKARELKENIYQELTK